MDIAMLVLTAISAGAMPNSARADAGTASPASASPTGVAGPQTHLAEPLRSGIHDVVIVPGADPTKQDIAGSYDKKAPGISGGIVQGSRLGSPTVDVGGINVGVSIPQLMLPGALVGGAAGYARQKVQDFRDALAKDLANADDQPLTNSRLALHVYQEIRSEPGLEPRLFAPSVPIPDDTDAILFVSINDVTIDVRGDDAILKTTAEITLRNRGDGTAMYQRWVYYQDQDSLANWTRNDNALWRDYANFASHYLGREVAAEVFTRVKLRHEIKPVKTKSLSIRRNDDWQGSSKSRTPTLAWALTLAGHNPDYPWAGEVDESNTDYDLEIYDTHRLVYAEHGIPDPAYTLATSLDACRTYRWTVRPAYRIGGSVKYGEWMRAPSASGDDAGGGNTGENASEAPAYLQGFPSLKIDCRAK
jgi:hypothetical protein